MNFPSWLAEFPLIAAEEIISYPNISLLFSPKVHCIAHRFRLGQKLECIPRMTEILTIYPSIS
jgi:hypothetical protein